MTPAARLRTGLGAALLVASSWLAVASSDAQSVPPLTQKTSPNRVGVNNANPASTLDINGTTNAVGNVTVNGTVNATRFSGDGSSLTNLPAPVLGTGSGHGQVRLVKNGASLQLCPHQGNRVVVDGTSIAVPGSCVSLGTDGLAADTTYYIYLAMNGGTPALQASTTAYAIGASGVATKTGDASKTLVGMARTNAATQWVDSPTQRFVASYFSRRARAVTNWLKHSSATTAPLTAPVEIDTSIRCEFLVWADENVLVGLTGAVQNGGSTLTMTVTGVSFSGSASEVLHRYENAVGGPAIRVPLGLTYAKSDLTEGYQYATLVGGVSGGGATWDGNITQSSAVNLSVLVGGL